jgi:hypothetical protein
MELEILRRLNPKQRKQVVVISALASPPPWLVAAGWSPWTASCSRILLNGRIRIARMKAYAFVTGVTGRNPFNEGP